MFWKKEVSHFSPTCPKVFLKVYCQNYFSSRIRQSSLVGCPPETRACFKCFKLLVDGSVNVRPIFLQISEVVVSEVGRECTYLCSSPFSEFNPTIFKTVKKKDGISSTENALHGLNGSYFPILFYLTFLALRRGQS